MEERDKIVWCLAIKNGIKITAPSEEEYKSYMERAKDDLVNLKEEKVPESWVPVVAYYSAYYALYSLLRLLGIKSENHLCSVMVFKFIMKMCEIEENVTKTLLELKKKRELTQYYLKKVNVDFKCVEQVVEFVENVKEKVLLRREKIRAELIELAAFATEGTR